MPSCSSSFKARDFRSSFVSAIILTPTEFAIEIISRSFIENPSGYMEHCLKECAREQHRHCHAYLLFNSQHVER
jgi:hypothetical protein